MGITKGLMLSALVAIVAGCGEQSSDSVKIGSNNTEEVASDTENSQSVAEELIEWEQRHICRRAEVHSVNVQGPFDKSLSKVILGAQDQGIKVQDRDQQKFTVTFNRSCAKDNRQSSVYTQASEMGPEIESTTISASDDQLSSLENDECVLYIGSAGTMVTSNTDTFIAQQAHLPAIGATEVFNQIYDTNTGVSEDVVVAIIDTGIQSNHPDLSANMWVNSDEVAGNGRPLLLIMVHM